MLEYTLNKLNELIEQQAKQIKELEAEIDWWHELIDKHYKNRNRTYVENLQRRIKELEAAIRDVCDLINKSKAVSKWKIFNWLDKALTGK